MPSEEQHVEEDDAEAEGIVLLRSMQATERLALQLRRREEGHAHIAGVDPYLVDDLEGIAVDEHYRAVAADERIAVVDVADHVSLRMHLREGARHVGRRAHHETKIRFRER